MDKMINDVHMNQSILIEMEKLNRMQENDLMVVCFKFNIHNKTTRERMNIK